MRRYVIVVLLIGIFISPKTLGGSVVNSVHNLSIPPLYHNGPYEADWDNYHEVCIYCHTPHNATVNVPLWNRQLGEPTAFIPYQSPTMRANSAYPSEMSLLCLSCHDGTTALDAVANLGNSPVHSKGNHSRMTGGSCLGCHSPEYWYTCHGCDTNDDFRGTFIGRDLSNDHPISVDYIPSPKLQPRPVDDKFDNGVKLINGKVECASCHNVHDPGFRPFMRTSNAGSALCYTCHDK